MPATLSWAIRLLLLEAAGLAGLTAYLIVRLLTADNVHVGVAVALIVLAALGAAAVAVVVRHRLRRVPGADRPALAGLAADRPGPAHRTADRAAGEHPGAGRGLTGAWSEAGIDELSAGGGIGPTLSE
jgi:hypothetical protein